MAATAQSNIEALRAVIEADNTITTAQKAQCQTMLYGLSQILFQNAADRTINGHAG
jgi:hypothetical protein